MFAVVPVGGGVSLPKSPRWPGRFFVPDVLDMMLAMGVQSRDSIVVVLWCWEFHFPLLLFWCWEDRKLTSKLTRENRANRI